MHSQLDSVSRGFRQVLLGLVLDVLAVGVALMAVFVFLGAAGNAVRGKAEVADRQFGWVQALGVVSLLLALGGVALGLWGRVLCLRVPKDAADAVPMIYASIGVQIAGVLAALLNQLDTLAGPFLGSGAKAVVAAAANLLPLVSAILFLLFTQSVAHFVRQPGLAQRAGTVLRLWSYSIGLYVTAVALTLALRGVGACLGSVLMLPALVMIVVSVVQYAGVLLAMQTAVLDYADYAADDEGGGKKRKKRRRVRVEAEGEPADEGKGEDEPRPRRKRHRAEHDAADDA